MRRANFQRDNLRFQVADALDLPFEDESFDVVICSHVYEHVPDPDRMFDEIFRVLRKDGICYFSAGNRLMWNEPHYNLPLLSVLPRPLAHVYIRLAGKARFYHEKHLSYWGLKSLVRRFAVTDYTQRLVVRTGTVPHRLHAQARQCQGKDRRHTPQPRLLGLSRLYLAAAETVGCRQGARPRMR